MHKIEAILEIGFLLAMATILIILFHHAI